MSSATKLKRRSCDRCYKNKQKCDFEIEAEICTLCSVSQAMCTTLRSRPRQGRRPTVQHLGPKKSVHIWEVTSTNSSDPSQMMVKTNETHFFHTAAALGSPYESLLHLSEPDNPFESSPDIIIRFSTNYSVFMSTPRLAPCFRAALQKSYACSPLLLRDIYSVLFLSIPSPSDQYHGQKATTTLNHQSNIVLRTSSLQKLRTARVTNIQHAFAVIALGQALAAFELLTNCVGSMLILRYSLRVAKEWYSELAREESMDAVMICPVFWDTVHSAFRGEVPVVRFSEREGVGVVDRIGGICTGLLGILYDLCVVGKRVKDQRRSGSGIDTTDLTEIEQRLISWTSRTPSNFTIIFSPQEIIGMEIQSSLYRTASLLLIHRIINPIGTHDSVAISLANSILLEFSRYSAHTVPGLQVPYVAFPVLLATLEDPNVSMEIWESMPLLALAPICVGKIVAFVEYAWDKRRNGFEGFLYQLVDSGPEFIVVP